MIRHRLLFALLAAALAPGARAETSPWYVGVSQAFFHDSNLYRIDENVLLGEEFSRSDTVSITSLVGGLDQAIGRQRVYGSLALRNNRYQNNDYLDDTSYSVTGGLDWSTAERFSGTVSVAGSEQQRKFNVDTAPGTVETRKNAERVNQVDAVFRVGAVTRLTFEGNLGYRQVDYSAPEYTFSEYEQARVSLGLRYRPGIAIFGASLGLSETNYSAATERLRRTSLDLTGYWPANGVSSLYARLSPTRVEYDQFSQRDFSGVTGALKWEWQPTGKLKFVTQLVHDIGQDSNFETFGGPVVVGTNNTGRVTTELRLTADYALASKVALNAGFTSAHRSLEQTSIVGDQAVVLAAGTDDTSLLSLGVRWTPMRSVELGCSLARDRRSASGGLSQDYTANTANCYGQFTLQ